jgi:hypothetical protein
MRRNFIAIVCFAAALPACMPARAQQPSAEAVAAARELVTTSRAGDQFKAILPILMQHLKPAVVQGRPQVERDFDVIMPMLIQGMTSRLDELTDAMANIYAQNFTVAEMRQLIQFYRSPIGQKLLEKTPAVAQQSMAVGQQFAARLVEDMKGRMIEELRKRGHKI